MLVSFLTLSSLKYCVLQPQSPPDPKPGIILSMRLQNFMCHDHLAFEFNSHLNFIVGPNGSGKSAVLTGLQVALGAAAKETERGAKLGGKAFNKYYKNMTRFHLCVLSYISWSLKSKYLTSIFHLSSFLLSN